MYGGAACNGQAIKTRNLSQVLKLRYPDDEILELDTDCFSSRLLENTVKFLSLVCRSDVVIVLPTLRLLLPLSYLMLLSRPFSKGSYVYVVIGGWLPNYCQKSQHALRGLKAFDHVYVETSAMCRALSKLGAKNVKVASNFSMRPSVEASSLPNSAHSPLRLCTFSRVIEEKGILEAVRIARHVREGGISCTLDIYGPCKKEFQHKLESALLPGEPVRLGGVLSGDEVAYRLSEYDVLLFPTFYEGEGFPGSLIDAFGAGLPVVCSDWHDNDELVKNGQTGFVVPTHDIDAFANQVLWLARNPDSLYQMRLACLEERSELYPAAALRHLFSHIDAQRERRAS